MRISRFSNRLALLVAFLVCIGAGFTLAVVLRERRGGGTAEVDPCYGQGEMVASWEHERTQADIDSLKASRPELADMKPGLVEYRRCRWGPGYEVIIDEKGNVFSFSQPSLAELEAYYKEHPEENPQNQMATAQAQSRQEMSVTPALPDPTVMAENVLAGCDPSWESQDFPSAGLRLCYPRDWQVLGNEPELSIGNDVSTMYFTSKASGAIVPDCPDPAVIETPSGEAKLCEARPNLVEEGQGHSLVLPGASRQVRYFITKPTLDNKWLALRIALAAEELP